MQTPNNLRQSTGILARGREVNALVNHAKANAAKMRSGLAATDIRFPIVPVIVSTPLTITPNPDNVTVYACETQLPDNTYPPHLKNTTHENNMSGELWDYRMLSETPPSGPQLQPGTVCRGTLWTYNDDTKRYVFVLLDYASGAQKCLVTANGVDGDGFPTYDIFSLNDPSKLHKLNDDPVVTENYHDPDFTYVAGFSGTYERNSAGDIYLDVPNEYPVCT